MEDSGPAWRPDSIDATMELLGKAGYVSARPLAVAVFLSLSMRRPLFLEGEAGVGKTEVARALAGALGRELIRLQCYEGLDVAAAAYEWDYPRQMLSIRVAEASGDTQSLAGSIYDPVHLLRRPLLRALDGEPGREPVLLIDELDRADEPFEAFLLEFLGEFQVSVPEMGTIVAKSPPLVVITSNRTREVHDAVKRRCLYHWVDYPDPEREEKILRGRVPEASPELARQIVEFVNKLRGFDLFKLPGVAETIDWAAAILSLGKRELDPETVEMTLGALLKYRDDLEKIRTTGTARMLGE